MIRKVILPLIFCNVIKIEWKIQLKIFAFEVNEVENEISERVYKAANHAIVASAKAAAIAQSGEDGCDLF